LASPPLVVAYAIAGRMTLDLTVDPLGVGRDGEPVYLRDIWPTEREIQETMLRAVNAQMFREQYADVFTGDDRWRSLSVPTGDRFAWDPDSTYIRNPPFFEELTLHPAPLKEIAGARALALLGDSITTDHISPAGSIKKDSPARNMGQARPATGRRRERCCSASEPSSRRASSGSIAAIS